MTQRLKELGERIGEAGVRREQQAQDLREHEMESQQRASNIARGFQLSGEFVAGVVLGGAIGWTADYFAGISPWGLIVGLLLGFAAGTLNVMRSAGVIAPQGSSWMKKD
ncbi:MAG TPA: AtpZ/AtpI family protein [Xanthobacteraceae bacterium]|nr:AtpZ/AtpI family protein [Xanthobacteraceae bacterium]